MVNGMSINYIVAPAPLIVRKICKFSSHITYFQSLFLDIFLQEKKNVFLKCSSVSTLNSFRTGVFWLDPKSLEIQAVLKPCTGVC